ncbi:MAG: UDP-N-acetylmuramoyl-tripeptide--D-alanyl-D-alanine ligase [Crocinitomicaceae bacterium]
MEKKELFEKCLEFHISIDTRNILKNDVFIALKGENFDGNLYCQQALANGAKFCISDDKCNENLKDTFIVENSLTFLQELANYKRNKMDIPFIGITGSNGKTTNKELIHAVLSKKYSTSATKGNLNNHIGVPLTILSIPKDTEIAIVEMGANQPNDIIELALIAEPNFGIITNIGAAHLEGFGNLEGVLNTKKQLFEYLSKSRENTIVCNGDDERVRNILPNVNIFYFGKGQDLKSNQVIADPFLNFSYSYKDYHSPIIQTKLIGTYNINNFLAAISFGILFKVPFEEINAALTNYTPNNNRSQLEITAKNKLIVDCYNANPTSMQAAIENMIQIPGDNKLCILGDMLELGKESEREHAKIVSMIKDSNIPTYFIGKEFQKTLLNSKDAFESSESLINSFNLDSIKDKIILLKGSRGIQLEKLIEYL